MILLKEKMNWSADFRARETSGREDDQNEEAVRHRISVYHEKTAPVADIISLVSCTRSVTKAVEAIYSSLESLVKSL